jgi:hypothetical protein
MTKQIYDLDENDIRKFKIWEFLSENHKDADDEATVMAHEKAPEKEPSSIYIHHAVFTANDGTITRIICSALTGLRPSADSTLSHFLLAQEARQSLRAVEPQIILRVIRDTKNKIAK